MIIGEVCMLTNDVVRLANFYKKLFGIEDNCMDDVHQFIFTEETQFTIYNDGNDHECYNSNISLAFTVEDVDAEYEKLLGMGVRIIEKPVTRPWGARNMSFYDPDGNVIYFRQL